MTTVSLGTTNEAPLNAVDDVYSLAVQRQEAGDIDQAVALYLQILKGEPSHAGANHNLGFIEAHTKSIKDALPRFEAAITAKPEVEQYWVSYIDALVMSGAIEAAASAIALGQNHGVSADTAKLLGGEVAQAIQSASASRVQNVFAPCSNEALAQLLTAVVAANTKEPLLVRLPNDSVSPDLNLSAFEPTINRLREEGRFNEILEIIFKSVLSIKLRPEFIGNKIYTPYFDAVLEGIGLNINPVIPKDKKIANVIIASEIYESGGHTKVIAELLDTLESPILVITDIYDRFAQSDLFARIAATFPSCPVFVLPREPYLDKAIRLAGFINTCAKHVFLVSHHDDPVAIVACQNTLDTSYYFIHHADHNPSLGGHVKHFHHVDLFADIARLCANDLKRDVSVLPIYAKDLGRKQFHYPIKRFSTVSAGTSNKFNFFGPVHFAELIVSAIRTCGGKHYHFGGLSDEQIQLIHAHLTRAEIATESFIYMGNVSSLWNGLLTIDAHIYIGSFPMRGGKGEIEAQGASFPLLIYKDPNDPKYLNVAHCNPLTQNWHDQSDFCEGLRSIILAHQKCSSESRDFYLTHHTKTRYVAALSRLTR
jgi:protein O-GlcNAc transferase